MENDFSPTLPHAHQQIRLGDNQASAHKWPLAIEYYLRAIDYLKTIQKTLNDPNLISNIQAQIVQCEKTIHLCRLKDRFEQVERVSKLTRAHSTSDINTPGRSYQMLTRHNTFQIDNPVLIDSLDGKDSFSNLIFSKPNSIHERSPKRTRIIAKKNQKHDAHKLEELQMSYEALKTHLKAAFDDIERLKQENSQLRTQKGIVKIDEQNDNDKVSSNSENDDDQETELEATL